MGFMWKEVRENLAYSDTDINKNPTELPILTWWHWALKLSSDNISKEDIYDTGNLIFRLKLIGKKIWESWHEMCLLKGDRGDTMGALCNVKCM